MDDQNEWITICRGFSEVRLSRRLTLLQWAERGRLLPSDYVFDRNLDTWVPAIDLSELATFFRQRRTRGARTAVALILTAMAATCIAEPVMALLLLVAGN